MRTRYFIVLFLCLGLSMTLFQVVSGNSLDEMATPSLSLMLSSDSQAAPLQTGLFVARADKKSRAAQSDLDCPRLADINEEGSVNIVDIQLVTAKRGLTPDDAEWDADLDVNGDDVINDQDVSLVAGTWRTPLLPCVEVKITSPDNLELFNSNSITVTGVVTGATGTPIVKVNETIVTPNNGTFTAEIELREGNNTITALAQDGDNADTASVQVTLDTTPPTVLIESPASGLVTNNQSLSVSGLVNDIVQGTVNSQEAQVTVSSPASNKAAEVANRSFLAADLTLSPGVNVITAAGTDQAGNTATTNITVTYETLPENEPQLRLLSGNNQSGSVGEELAERLVVKLTDGDGNPMANERIVFKVTENNGEVSDGTDMARSLVLTTTAQGEAEASWKLGSRSGAGNNMVEASAVGFVGQVNFTAIALPEAPGNIVMDTGNNQTGSIGQSLPEAFGIVVTDEGHNRLAGIEVVFRVVEGGGKIEAQEAITLTTDSDGRAFTLLTLGDEAGPDNNVVEARFAGYSGLPVTFVASSVVAGDPSKTTISGVVLDNTDKPIEGITVGLKEENLTAQTDAQGQFKIEGEDVPVGNVHLIVNPDSAQHDDSRPALEFELVTIAGNDNTLGMPIYLLELDQENELCVSATEGGTLTLPDLPGFSLTVEPGAATFLDGSNPKEGCISVTRVNADKMPMPPNFGQQPRLALTIQPHGTLFEPAAKLTMPNTDGLAPGEVTEMYSFDHDLAQFVSIGTATVSNDGTMLVSDPGVGVVKAGWHCGGNPATTVGIAEEVDVVINLPKRLNLRVGDSKNAQATGTPPNPGQLANGQTVKYEWVSSDPNVKILNQPGNLIGTHPNNVIIKVLSGATVGSNVTLTVTYTCPSGATDTAEISVRVR
ncbi:MAG: hypothetical protein ACPGWR_19205 [Ardenticatenaceae bacterium]